LDAFIFDFDGVVVDSEPIHLMGFQRVLAGAGLALTEKDYYEKYLGYDDHDAILIAGREQGVAFDEPRIAELTAAKSRIVQQAFAESIQALPGAVELIAAAARAGIPVGVCSGALREEIELAAATVGARGHFLDIVAAKDVRRGKPDPEGYVLALERLRAAIGRTIRPEKSLAVEDSPAGIAAARGAGMKVLAVATSYDPHQLTQADRTVGRLSEVTLAELEALVR
jgi:HAD superfamily hydrolase (TIGR01509 family)